MDDVIYRQDVLNLIPQNISDFEEGSSLAYDVGKLPSAQQWIPAHNIFPGENGKYLVTGKHGAVNIIKYEDGRWYGGMSPIAWMPLPSPYREEVSD